MYDKLGLIGCSNGPVSGFSTLSIVDFITLYHVNEDGKVVGVWFGRFSDVHVVSSKVSGRIVFATFLQQKEAS